MSSWNKIPTHINFEHHLNRRAFAEINAYWLLVNCFTKPTSVFLVPPRVSHLVSGWTPNFFSFSFCFHTSDSKSYFVEISSRCRNGNLGRFLTAKLSANSFTLLTFMGLLIRCSDIKDRCFHSKQNCPPTSIPPAPACWLWQKSFPGDCKNPTCQ